MTTLTDHPAVTSVAREDDGLHVTLASTRPRIINDVLTYAARDGRIPRETRQRRGGLLLVLADDVNDLPAEDDAREQVIFL